MTLSQLTIFGAGLIGGSIALAARKRGLATRIVAIDCQSAPPPTQTPVFDEWVDATKASAVDACLAQSELTVLCVPVRTIIELLPEILNKTPGLVTDCGSTKRAVVESITSHPNRSRFVPGHPMAGHPVGGLENARATLFDGRTWLLCPQDDQAEAAAQLSEIIQQLGAEIIELSPEQHDASVAMTSHIPQVLASSLAVFAKKTDALSAAGPGFASVTRVAGGAEAMWRDIFETNGGPIGRELVQIARHLESLGESLQNGDASSALQLLEEARSLRDAEG